METEEVKIVLEGSFKNKQAIIDALKKIDKGVKSVKEESVKTEKQVNSLSASLKKLAKIVGLSILVKKFIGLGKASLTAAGKMQQYNVAFTTMLGSAEKAKTLMSEAIKFAKKTPFQLDGVLDATKQLLAYQIAQEDVLPTLRNLGDISAGTGADLRLIAKAYGDIKTKGKLAGQEVMQLANANIPIIEELAKTFGLTTTEISNMQEKGQISFEMVKQAIRGMTAEGGTFFNLMDAQSKTFLGTVSNMQDGFFQVKVALGSALLPVAQEVVNKMIVWFEELKISIEANSKAITDFARTFVKVTSGMIKTLGLFIKGVAFLISQPLIKWLAIAVLGLKALDKAMLLISKNAIVAVITALIVGVGLLRDGFLYLKENIDDTSIAFLEMGKVWLKLELKIISGVSRIVNALGKISKISGFGGADKWADKVTDIADSIDEIDKRIEEIRKRKPIEKIRKKEDDDKKKKTVDDNKEVEISAERAKRLKEIEDEKNEALLQSELDFMEGKTTQKELEAEQDAIRKKEELALLQEDFIAKLENQTLNDEERLLLKEEFETKKAEIDKKYKVSEGAFQKAFNVASAKVQAQADKMKVKAGDDLYTNLTSSIDAFAQHNKAAARAQQVISAGETIVATYLGATKALAIGGGFPTGLPQMFATIAQGLGNLATIKAQSFAVGASEIPQDMMAQIHAGEMIIPASFAQSIRAGELSLGGGETQGGAGSQSTININFEGANFYGEINDDMLVEIGTRLSELINEDLLTPLPTGAG